MAEAPKTVKMQLTAGKYTRREKNVLVRYKKGDIVELAAHEVRAFGDKFANLPDPKQEVSKPIEVKQVTAPPQDATTPKPPAP